MIFGSVAHELLGNSRISLIARLLNSRSEIHDTFAMGKSLVLPTLGEVSASYGKKYETQNHDLIH